MRHVTQPSSTYRAKRVNSKPTSKDLDRSTQRVNKLMPRHNWHVNNPSPKPPPKITKRPSPRTNNPSPKILETILSEIPKPFPFQICNQIFTFRKSPKVGCGYRRATKLFGNEEWGAAIGGGGRVYTFCQPPSLSQTNILHANSR